MAVLEYKRRDCLQRPWRTYNAYQTQALAAWWLSVLQSSPLVLETRIRFV